MNTYLIIGAFSFEYEGNITQKNNDGVRELTKGILEGYKIVLQETSSNDLFLLTLSENVEQVNIPKSKSEYNWKFDYYGYWSLEKAELDLMYCMTLIPRGEENTHITLPKTQLEQPNINHELFHVSYEGNSKANSFFKQGEVWLEEKYWRVCSFIE